MKYTLVLLVLFFFSLGISGQEIITLNKDLVYMVPDSTFWKIDNLNNGEGVVIYVALPEKSPLIITGTEKKDWFELSAPLHVEKQGATVHINTHMAIGWSEYPVFISSKSLVYTLLQSSEHITVSQWANK